MAYLFGNSGIMHNLELRVHALARSGMPVLIEGETGTGKEALARYLHDARRGGGPWVKFICGNSSSPQEFTRMLGRPNETVFLKHLDRLPLQLQERLLSELDRETGRWFLSGVANSLQGQVNRNEFLPALYHRLSAFRIHLPRLRERSKDIPELFAEFLRRWGVQENLPIPDSVLKALDQYHWPGNLRELENLARAYLITNDPAAIVADLCAAGKEPLQLNGAEKPAPLKCRVKQASRRIESQIILDVLERNRWNRRRTAENLQISYRSLLYKMKECKIRQEACVREPVE